MELTQRNTNQFALYYAACFYLVGAWYIWHGLTLSGLQPVFFVNKADITGQLILWPGLQHKLINNSSSRMVFDAVFYLLPAILCGCFVKRSGIVKILGWFTALYSLVYCYLFSTLSFVSIEPLIAWFFIPLMFTRPDLAGFYFKLHMMRILFVIFFASAGLWKIRAGGIFNPDQMSGILVAQHAAILSSGEQSLFIRMLTFFINHPLLSNMLYWIVAAGELFFLVGIFTKRYDRILIVILVSFLLFDYILMQINYFSWLPFAACFYYSQKKYPVEVSLR